ncbi:hypothetical protein CLOP_g22042 [Closterium sp. NIES-67]|nr:hypothetical protein CLOP_g22042 [Closterium sp. NIES-67]
MGATFLRVEEDISGTPPYAESTCTGLGAGPQFSGSDGRTKRVRVKVVQQRGMKEGVTPNPSMEEREKWRVEEVCRAGEEATS